MVMDMDTVTEKDMVMDMEKDMEKDMGLQVAVTVTNTTTEEVAEALDIMINLVLTPLNEIILIRFYKLSFKIFDFNICSK